MRPKHQNTEDASRTAKKSSNYISYGGTGRLPNEGQALQHTIETLSAQLAEALSQLEARDRSIVSLTKRLQQVSAIGLQVHQLQEQINNNYRAISEQGTFLTILNNQIPQLKRLLKSSTMVNPTNYTSTYQGSENSIHHTQNHHISQQRQNFLSLMQQSSHVGSERQYDDFSIKPNRSVYSPHKLMMVKNGNMNHPPSLQQSTACSSYHQNSEIGTVTRNESKRSRSTNHRSNDSSMSQQLDDVRSLNLRDNAEEAIRMSGSSDTSHSERKITILNQENMKLKSLVGMLEGKVDRYKDQIS